MIVQDDLREKHLIELFGLLPGEGNRIGVDAFDRHGNPFELKTTSKKSVSTARDLGLAHLEKWEKRYWIIATFDARTGAYSQYFFFAPKHMRGWYQQIRTRLDACNKLISKATKQLVLDPTELKKVTYWMQRGTLLNDPNIPWSYVQKNGIEIASNHAAELTRLIEKFPLDVASPVEDPFADLIRFY